MRLPVIVKTLPSDKKVRKKIKGNIFKPDGDFNEVKYDMTTSCCMCVITPEEFENTLVKKEIY